MIIDLSTTGDGPGHDLPRQLPGIVRRLAYEYSNVVDEQEVQRLVADSYSRLATNARITTYLPELAERLARERIEALAQSEGKIAKRVPEVLFVCTHNAGRSQMAAAFARHYGGEHLHIRTGGSEPGLEVHPEVVLAMKEVGLSTDEEFPKPLTDEVLSAADVVVTMGCGDSCPHLPGRRYEDWEIPDPSTATADEVRAIRDDVDQRVRALLAQIIPGQTASS